MELKSIKIEKPKDVNIILGQSHFIKTVEDMHETIITSAPNAKFGIAFCESSGAALVRYSGNTEKLIEMAKNNAFSISAGHSFIVFLEDLFPINVLNSIKMIPEVCRIFCATANDVEVVVTETAQGRGILGVIDGVSPKGFEDEEDITDRKNFLREFGYKL